MEGVFFYWSAQISVLKRKTLFNQWGSFVHREFHGTESLIGCPSFFILVLKIGRTSQKNHPVYSKDSPIYINSLWNKHGKSYLQNIDNIGNSFQNDSLKYSTVAAVHLPQYFKAAYCRRFAAVFFRYTQNRLNFHSLCTFIISLQRNISLYGSKKIVGHKSLK